MRALLSSEPEKDHSGVLIFSYRRGFFHIMLIITIVLVLGAIYDPPKEAQDIAAAVILIGSAIYMCIHSCKFHLVLKDNIIFRSSPWPWHKDNFFEFNKISTIEVGGYPLRLRIKINNGESLSVPLLLRGAFRLLHIAMNNSNATTTKEARNIIDYYVNEPDHSQ